MTLGRKLMFSAALGAAAGTLYWLHHDWWAYVETQDRLIPKFEMPLWWQLGESGFVGFGVATVVAVAWAPELAGMVFRGIQALLAE